MSRLLLALECATSTASVALLRDGEIACEEVSEDRRHHAQTLLGLVDRVLKRSAVEFGEIEALAVSVGPGAFTSLRVGIATVKGLGFGSSMRVAPVSTLQALAFEVAPEEARGLPVAALLDARREEVYGGLYAANSMRPEESLPEGVYAVEELAARLPASCALVGSGADLHAAALGAGPLRVVWPARAPRARWVARLGADALARGEGVLVAALVPRYLRRSDAEVARERLGRA